MKKLDLTPEERKERKREQIRGYNLKNKYRNSDGSPFTQTDYERMLSAQGGHCAVPGCSVTPELNTRVGRGRLTCDGTLCIDHDHDTGVVRGLLCQRHNLGLGKLGDNVSGLLQGVRYLRGRHKVRPNTFQCVGVPDLQRWAA